LVKIPIDPRVTIITGANDVGKSSVLKAIELAFGTEPLPENFINCDYAKSPRVDIDRDDTISVCAEINLTSPADIEHERQTVEPGDRAEIVRKLAKAAAKFETTTHLRRHGGSTDRKLKLPLIVKPTFGEKSGIRQVIDLKDMTPLEKAFIDAAFDGPFEWENFQRKERIVFIDALHDAEERINGRLGKLIAARSQVRFKFIADGGSELTILIRDQHGGATPFGTRGSGVRKMITLLAELLTLRKQPNHRVILLDEPENSLHPDAQHLLREFLFRLTEDGKTQVIYVTHSTAMLSPMRSEQMRVLIRTRRATYATCKLLERPTDGNFEGLRSVLGVTFADSLVFAPVVVISEGATEVGCLWQLVAKLKDTQSLQRFDIGKLLGLVNIMDGNGDSFVRLCRFVRTFQVRVVMFLDGDKRARVRQSGFESEFPNVPIVFTDGESAIEDLVPPRYYFQAVRTLLGDAIPADLDIEQEVMAWTAERSFRARKAFAERVCGYFEERHDVAYPAKKEIMQEAIKCTPAEEINSAPIVELLNEIKKALESGPFGSTADPLDL
jgi:predicted ATP-dependent endonuclease of OLD family